MTTNIEYKKNNLKKYILYLLPVVFMTIIFVIILLNGVHKIDVYILSKISLLVNDKLTVIMKLVTSLCSPIFMLVLIVLAFILFKDKRLALGVLMALIFSVVSNLALKSFFSRERPLEFMLIDESGYSFPSGHSMVSIAFYGFLIYLCYKLIKNKKLKVIAIFSLSLIIALIAFSRLYLGVHYPTDVLAGLTSGYVFLGVYIIIFKRYIMKEKNND